MGTHSPLEIPSNNEDLLHGPSSWRPRASLEAGPLLRHSPPRPQGSRLLHCCLYGALSVGSHISHLLPITWETSKILSTVFYQLIRRLCCLDFPIGAVVKNLPANTEVTGSIPGFGRSPGGGNGNQMQHYCLENCMDRGAWWAAVHGVAELVMTEWQHARLTSLGIEQGSQWLQGLSPWSSRNCLSVPTGGQGWRWWLGALSLLWCRLACLILEKLLLLYGATSSPVNREHHKPHDCRTMGKSGRGGGWSPGEPVPFPRGSLALADGYHLGPPLFSWQAGNCSVCMNLSLVKCLLRWHKQLMFGRPSSTSPWARAGCQAICLSPLAWRPFRSHAPVEIWNPLEPSSLPSGSSRGSELMFSFQLKISYSEAHRCSFCSLWLSPCVIRET